MRELRAAGADFVKVSSEPSKETYLAVADECNRLRMPFVGHLPRVLTAREAIEAGQVSIEHMGNGMLREQCFGYFPEDAPPPPDMETAPLKEALNAVFAGRPPAGVWGESTRTMLSSPQLLNAIERVHRELGLIESLQVLYRGPNPEDAKLVVRAKHAKGEDIYTFHLVREGKIEWVKDEQDELQPEKVRQLAERLVARRVWLTPTLLAHHNAAARRELLKTPDPRLDYLPPKVRRQLVPDADERIRDLTSADIDEFKRLNARDAQLVVLLHKAGARILARTDAGVEYCPPGFGLHEELALLVQAGLSPGEALRTATIEPAAFLGRERESGSIEVGKRADLVLLDRNPLTDIRNTSSVWGVIRAGKYLNRAALDQMLKAVRTRATQM